MIFLPSKRNIHCHHEQKNIVGTEQAAMTDLVENDITVKVEYTDELEEQQPSTLLPPPPPPPKTGECLWCSKKLVVKCTIAGFCSETCFTASRRARFKKEKFGIDTVPRRSPPSKPESTSPKPNNPIRKDYQGKMNYQRQLHRQRQLHERLAKRSNGDSLKRKYNQTRGQNDDELALTDLSEIAKLSNLMKRAHEAASLAIASAPEMVTISTQTDSVQLGSKGQSISTLMPSITMVPVFIPVPIPLPSKLLELAVKTHDQSPLDLSVKRS